MATGLLLLAGLGQLSLSWGNPSPSPATGIVVERSEAGNVCVFTPVATLPLVETWMDAPVAAGQTWCYRVLATTDTGLTSVPSNVACGTAEAAPPPPPTTVSQTFTRVGSTSATFTLPLAPYACVRRMGGTADLRIMQDVTERARVPFANTRNAPTFTLTCTVTPTTVTLAIDGVLTLTAPR